MSRVSSLPLTSETPGDRDLEEYREESGASPRRPGAMILETTRPSWSRPKQTCAAQASRCRFRARVASNSSRRKRSSRMAIMAGGASLSASAADGADAACGPGDEAPEAGDGADAALLAEAGPGDEASRMAIMSAGALSAHAGSGVTGEDLRRCVGGVGEDSSSGCRRYPPGIPNVSPGGSPGAKWRR